MAYSLQLHGGDDGVPFVDSAHDTLADALTGAAELLGELHARPRLSCPAQMPRDTFLAVTVSDPDGSLAYLDIKEI